MIYPYATYDGLYFGLSSLGTNVYLNSLIVGVAELLCYIAGCKRKKCGFRTG